MYMCNIQNVHISTSCTECTYIIYDNICILYSMYRKQSFPEDNSDLRFPQLANGWFGSDKMHLHASIRRTQLRP